MENWRKWQQVPFRWKISLQNHGNVKPIAADPILIVVRQPNKFWSCGQTIQTYPPPPPATQKNENSAFWFSSWEFSGTYLYFFGKDFSIRYLTLRDCGQTLLSAVRAQGILVPCTNTRDHSVICKAQLQLEFPPTMPEWWAKTHWGTAASIDYDWP